MNASASEANRASAKPSFARLAESVVGLVRTRAELAGVEFVEERERLIVRLALLLGGVMVVALAALFAGLLLVALFWDTHRLAIIAFLALLYAFAGALLIAKARAIGREAPGPFAATLAELEKDRLRLRRAAQDAATGG